MFLFSGLPRGQNGSIRGGKDGHVGIDSEKNADESYGSSKKAGSEFDGDRRRRLVKVIQRCWANKHYTNPAPGGSNTLRLVWLALKNYRVYKAGTFDERDLWVDPNEASLKRANVRLPNSDRWREAP